VAIILPGDGGGDGGGSGTGTGTTGTVSYTFTPPTVYDVPAILPTSMGEERRLFRYFKNRARYVMVFALSDGTFVQDTATPENSNTNIPYPYNPYDPSAPYATSYYINFEVKPPVPTVTTVAHDVWITKVYSTVTDVTLEEHDALASAGYGNLVEIIVT
jgi:hypothetical protein